MSNINCTQDTKSTECNSCNGVYFSNKCTNCHECYYSDNCTDCAVIYHCIDCNNSSNIVFGKNINDYHIDPLYISDLIKKLSIDDYKEMYAISLYDSRDYVSKSNEEFLSILRKDYGINDIFSNLEGRLKLTFLSYLILFKEVVKYLILKFNIPKILFYEPLLPMSGKSGRF
tara:strand:- start:63 stop:578 length:516 start_codon:yes stop_codon:yes gene_type:complete